VSGDLVPLMPALGVLVYKTLEACEDFSQALTSVILFPPPIAPGLYLFVRGDFNKSLVRIMTDAAERLGDPVPRPLAAGPALAVHVEAGAGDAPAGAVAGAVSSE